MLRYGGEGKAETEEEKVEEVKAEINYLLSGNRENDVATAQRFFTFPPFSGSLFPLALMKWHKRSLSGDDELHNNANCHPSV